jgi:hypothetical protein
MSKFKITSLLTAALNSRPPVQDKSTTYYERFGDRLSKQIREYSARRAASADLFSGQEMSLFDLVETGVTKHRLRYYQIEALYTLDYLLGMPPTKLEKKSLTEVIDEDAKIGAPFLGFEMATGSGKTMLMGASIFYVLKKYGIHNFLIITPASTDIYQKTILNFARGTFESVWANDAPFTYNLVTGDDYNATPLYDGFDPSRDLSIFIFNITKFGSNAINTTKEWESSKWKDQAGNTVSIRDYLQNEKLVIITDEAHHAQSRVSREIIKGFHPELVLEYTATAIEASRNEAKKSQTIVYKYDIRRLLEDGYGKTVKAVALNVEELGKRNKKQTDVPQNEKLKLITLVLIHLLKKNAVLRDAKIRGLKPIAFVKVKNETSFAQKVFDYLRSELHQDLESLEIILQKLGAQELEVTDLLQQLFNETFGGDLQRLRREIERVTQTAIFYHGKSDKETERKWNNVKRNEVEFVVYMQRLDEGIDLPNIYSMAVVADNLTEFKTSVKQIIGRGVRLGKEKREFDESSDLVLAQAEKLHVVCDQGAAFEEVILSIQKEFGLTDKYLSIERERQKVINHAKSERLEGLFLPEIKADLKARPNVMLMDLVRDVDKIADEYVKHNCFHKNEIDDPDIPSGTFLKFSPGAFFVEVDLFADQKIFHQQLRGKFPDEVLEMNESHANSIYAIVMKQLFCLPDNRESKGIFKRYIEKLARLDVRFYYSDDADKKLAQSRFITTFASFYRSYIEKHYFDLHFEPIVKDDAQSLNQRFSNTEMLIPSDQIKDKTWKRADAQKIKNLIEQGYQFFGYDESIYDYVKFDSFPEKQLADYANSILQLPDSGKGRFWVRNDRQVYFYYGTRRYYPDFLMFRDGVIYVLEIKGEIYSDTKKNILLSRLNTIDGYRGVLVYSDFMNRVTSETTWEDFLEGTSFDAEMRHGRERLVPEVPDEEKFVRFLPAYGPDAAYRKFVRNQAKTRIYGWLEVPAKSEGYSDNYFVVQMKGSAMAPDLPHNSWGIFKAKTTPRQAVGKIVICHHHSITDRDFGDKRVTIRRFNFEKITPDGALFDKIVVTLSPNAADLPVYDLKDISSDAGIEIAGVMIDSV